MVFCCSTDVDAQRDECVVKDKCYVKIRIPAMWHHVNKDKLNLKPHSSHGFYEHSLKQVKRRSCKVCFCFEKKRLKCYSLHSTVREGFPNSAVQSGLMIRISMTKNHRAVPAITPNYLLLLYRRRCSHCNLLRTTLLWWSQDCGWVGLVYLWWLYVGLTAVSTTLTQFPSLSLQQQKMSVPLSTLY